MARVIILSRTYPAYHPRKGEHTDFVEKFLKSRLTNESELDKLLNPISNFIYDVGQKLGYDYADSFLLEIDHSRPKEHTIRAGKRFKVGDYFSPRIWSGKPYRSKMIQIAPETLIESVWDFEIRGGFLIINNVAISSYAQLKLANNDGLSTEDLLAWFKYPKPFKGQIICWNRRIDYWKLIKND